MSGGQQDAYIVKVFAKEHRTIEPPARVLGIRMAAVERFLRTGQTHAPAVIVERPDGEEAVVPLHCIHAGLFLIGTRAQVDRRMERNRAEALKFFVDDGMSLAGAMDAAGITAEVPEDERSLATT